MRSLTSSASTRRQGRKRIASRYRRVQLRRRRSSQGAAHLVPPRIVEGVVVSIRDDYQPLEPPRVRERWRARALVGAVAVLSLALGVGLTLVLAPLLLASATITLTPEAHTITTSASIPLVARLFPADHESLSRTAATTGTAVQPASAARGSVTFYNALPAPQTIPAGTLLMSSGGIPVLTDEDAYIPPASPPTDGVSTVSARAENTGMTGNIAAGAIGGPCCRAYVLAYNGDFWGGVDARTYHTPTARDIASALAPLQGQVDERMQRAIHAWLQPGEVLLPPKCTSTTSSSAQPGAEADHVTVTVGATCTAAAYSESELQQAATATLAAVAADQFGTAYRLAGEVRTDIAAVSVASDRITFRVELSGLYVYRFSERQIASLKAQIAGGSRAHAAAILARMVGVTHVQIQSSNATLPSDPSRIHILLSMGLQSYSSRAVPLI